MASSPRARHARPRARRASLRVLRRPSPTKLAVGGMAAVYARASVLAVHVMSVPAHLRQDGAAGPAVGPTRHSSSASHVRPTEARAARSEQRSDRRADPTPTPTSATPSPQRAASSAPPAPAPQTSSARPSPHPSPSSSSGGPIPLPTLTAPGHG